MRPGVADMKPRRRIGLRSAGSLLTADEFDDLEPEQFDPRYRYELINGVLVVTPPPASAERGSNDELGILLGVYRLTHPQGTSLDETLPEHTVPCTPQRRRCDRAIWAGLGRQPDELNDVPTIVVEFVSQSSADARRDYEEKLREYLAAGVREYWIIDRFQRKMTVHRAGQDTPVVLGPDDAYQTDLLPGFVLPLARLLARADRWPPKRRRKPPARGNP